MGWPGRSGLRDQEGYGKVEAQRESPRTTGFERHLYRTDGIPDAQHVEKNFMSPLDNDAARALQKILSGDRSDWMKPERTAWTTFILSLFFRNPENVTIIKDRIRDLWEHGKAALSSTKLLNGKRRGDATMAASLRPDAARLQPSRNFACPAFNNILPRRGGYGRQYPFNRCV